VKRQEVSLKAFEAETDRFRAETERAQPKPQPKAAA
jgi:hypothetical protein